MSGLFRSLLYGLISCESFNKSQACQFTTEKTSTLLQQKELSWCLAARTSVLIDSYRIMVTCDSVYRCLLLSICVVPNQRLLSEQRVSTYFDSTVCRSRRTDTLSNSVFSIRVALKIIWRYSVQFFWWKTEFCII